MTPPHLFSTDDPDFQAISCKNYNFVHKMAISGPILMIFVSIPTFSTLLDRFLAKPAQKNQFLGMFP